LEMTRSLFSVHLARRKKGSDVKVATTHKDATSISISSSSYDNVPLFSFTVSKTADAVTHHPGLKLLLTYFEPDDLQDYFILASHFITLSKEVHTSTT
jgi:hypothetical protein